MDDKRVYLFSYRQPRRPTEATPTRTLFMLGEVFDLPHFGGRDLQTLGAYDLKIRTRPRSLYSAPTI